MDPALTAEEWRRARGTVQADANGVVYWGRAALHDTDDPERVPLEDENRGTRCHGLAALALYGQPFGFTREDVEAVESAYDVLFDHNVGPVSPTMARLWSLRDRIAALLPPPENPA